MKIKATPTPNRRPLVVGGLLSCLLLAGCATSPPVVQDSGPDEPVDVSHIPDAVPRVEPRTAAGNKSPYTVLGKTYELLPDAELQGFTQRGTASWYGRKFHGLRTSNGEVYNMYGMTAAHKSLPIPSFVEVTNLKNNKKVIVRVNDRGPFHGDRIIDLTYAAAKKLGFQSKGTAPVEIRVIDPIAHQSEQSPSKEATTATASTEEPAPVPRQAGGYDLGGEAYLQAGAFSSFKSATALQRKLEEITNHPVFIEGAVVDAVTRLFRVRIGPITDNFELVNLRELIQQNNLGQPHIVKE